MASLHPEPSGTIHVVLRIGGRRVKRSLGTKVESRAAIRRDAIVEMLDLIRRGRFEVPEHVPVVDFVMADGKIDSLPPRRSAEDSDGPRHPPIDVRSIL